jgi:hypothetical protein
MCTKFGPQLKFNHAHNLLTLNSWEVATVIMLGEEKIRVGSHEP